MKRKEAKKRSGIDKKDAALIATRAALSAVPFGGTVAQILSGIKPSYAKQLIEDVEEIYKRLTDYEKRVPDFNVEALEKDESFKALIAHWVQIAIRTHDKEKREALRNAVVNSAIKNPPEEDLRSTFLKWVDDLEPWHLRILKFLDDPEDWARRYGVTLPKWYAISVYNVVADVFLQLKDLTDFYLKGLIDRGLLINGSFKALLDARAALGSWTSSLGKKLLSFITSPIDDTQSDNKIDDAIGGEAPRSQTDAKE